MLSMGMLNSAWGCKKQEAKRVSVAHTPDRCRLQLLCDCCRWWWWAEEVEEVEVGEEAGARCALGGGCGCGNRSDDLDRLGDSQAGGYESAWRNRS